MSFKIKIQSWSASRWCSRSKCDFMAGNAYSIMQSCRISSDSADHSAAL